MSISMGSIKARMRPSVMADEITLIVDLPCKFSPNILLSRPPTTYIWTIERSVRTLRRQKHGFAQP